MAKATGKNAKANKSAKTAAPKAAAKTKDAFVGMVESSSKTKKPYTKADDRLIIKGLKAGKSMAEVAKSIGRSTFSCRARVHNTLRVMDQSKGFAEYDYNKGRLLISKTEKERRLGLIKDNS